jgi:valyl-tRNA synthetase
MITQILNKELVHLRLLPAHDFNDYDVGQRNNLEIINIFTEAGKINENAPKEYIG